MADSVRKNSFAKIALLLVGVFVSAVVVIIAFNVSKQAPDVVTVTNAPLANASTNAVADPVDPIQPDIIFAATGTVSEKKGNVLTVNAQIYVGTVITDRVYSVEVTPQTVYTQIENESGATSNITFSSIAVGDRVTFRADDNLLEKTSVVATLVDKIIN